MGNRPKYWCKRRVRLTSMSTGRFLLRAFVYLLRYIFSQNHPQKTAGYMGVIFLFHSTRK
jgi:hypothetical protein